ncbi:uncharacterized protein BYT42DRAFT_540823 [Radiomyces spectabilis]|uniref:uncharacterized protein n=1 Tax=Radiomyces spectabilis TaxID=64574 RepID=UPI00221FC97A|nr:uncharacterized protein BYT42DRAFT_540823 [Radiomyces spectabilis]KAI8365188.1 hypothetical protein BYT42DRAFT_540823 [Radiomyces spectabilis]
MSKPPVHSVLFDSTAPNSNTGYYDPNAGVNPGAGDGLQFYASSYGNQYGAPSYYANAPAGDMRSDTYDYTRGMGSFWSAFGTGGFADEPPLLEELGLNFEHIKTKSLTVLNPFGNVPHDIMDDTDLAGPLLFIFLFGIFLMLSGKNHFGYIYGVGVLGVVSIFLVMNLMSESGVDWSRTASVLGYCLLPMVMLSGFSVILPLKGYIGLVLTAISILWCTYASSGMFTTVLRMSEQRFLVAYPVGLFYACFALMTVY